MAELSGAERRTLERLLRMGGGYVLDFSDRTFADFFDEFRIDIDNDRYKARGTSKANRLRMHWELDANTEVGRILAAMIDYGLERVTLGDSSSLLIEDCRRIARRLLDALPVPELDALDATTDERDFEVVAAHVREAIEKNQPEAALDRLHTFVIKFVRVASEPYGISANSNKPLHSLFGEYVRALRVSGYLDSTMTERILKSSISVLEAFNHVRNNQSLAHDNTTLNYEESLLIFNHVAASVRFMKALEAKIKSRTNQ
jgi:hypothetical protein